MGGVGNQLFQIAMVYSLSKKYNGRLLLKKFDFAGCRQGSHPSKYYTTIYEKLEYVQHIDKPHMIIDDYREPLDYTKIERQLSNLKEDPSIILCDGYWQSMMYFEEYREEVKELFTPKEGIINLLERTTDIFTRFPELKEEHDYCFIGVRRGDYVIYPHCHNPCGLSYYSKAMQRMNKQRYYISSDDYEWCKRKFVGDQFKFFEIDDDLSQLLVATLFKNYIISNSSYHWWASFLSIYPDPSIIAPDQWLNEDKNPDIIYRPKMLVLEREVEWND
jgi:hypothetical protein